MYVIRPWLCIGTLRETFDEQTLHNEGIGAVLQLADGVAYRDLPALFLPVVDGEPLPHKTLSRGLAFVREHREVGHTVLIACALGISRSVTFTTASLREAEQTDLSTAFRAIRQAHPNARPNPVLWRSLCDYFGENTPYVESVLRGK